MLNTSKQSAKNHLEEEVESGAAPYTTQMWREEAIHRYNAGTGSGNEYWEWTPPKGDTPGEWTIVDRGGIGGYVPAVLGNSASCQ